MKSKFTLALALSLTLSLSMAPLLARAEDPAQKLCRATAEIRFREAYREAKAAEAWMGRQLEGLDLKLRMDSLERLHGVFDDFRKYLKPADRARLFTLGFQRPSFARATRTQEQYLAETPDAQTTVEKAQLLWERANEVVCREGFAPKRGPAVKFGIFENDFGSECVRNRLGGGVESVKPDLSRSIRLEASEAEQGAMITVCEYVRIAGENTIRYCNTQNLPVLPDQALTSGGAGDGDINGVPVWMSEREYVDHYVPMFCRDLESAAGKARAAAGQTERRERGPGLPEGTPSRDPRAASAGGAR